MAFLDGTQFFISVHDKDVTVVSDGAVLKLKTNKKLIYLIWNKAVVTELYIVWHYNSI